MGKTAILAIRIIGDATDAVSALDSTGTAAGRMQGTMDKASVGAGIALGALTAAATVAGNAASELEQATGAVDSVFGSYAGKVKGYAEEAATAVGLSTQQYSQMAAVLGSQLKNMGVPMEAVAGQTNDLVGLGADLSAMFGGTTADAIAALSSLLRGERDPIERYGVSINQAAIDAQKAAMGLSGLSGEAEKNANLQATLALLTQQTASAQGQFGREADTAAGQQQRANASWADASATLGMQLLPIMSEGAKMLASWAEWAGENSEVVTVLAAGIGILSAGILVINGAMKIFAAVQAVQTAAQWANNAAWLASPVTWIILAIIVAIGLVIAIVVLLITHWEDVQRVAGEVWGNVVKFFESVGAVFGQIVGAIGYGWSVLVASWQAGIEGFISWIRQALDWLGQLIGSAIPGWVKDLLGMNGQTFTAQMVIEEPPMMASRMAFTAADTMAGFAQPTAAKTTVAGLSSSADVAGLLRGGEPPRSGDTYNIDVTVGGLVTDGEDLARTLRKVLDDSDKTNGRVLAVTSGGKK